MTFRYRIRTVLLVFSILAMGFAYFAHKAHNAARQRRVISEVRKSGGQVFFTDGTIWNGEFEWTAPPPTTGWSGYFNDHALESVIGVEFYEQPIGAEDLQPVAQFPNLDWLIVLRTGVTDDAMPYLESHRRLRRLILDGSQLTDAGLVPLGRLYSLRELCLKDTAVTDEGLSKLTKLERLRILDVRRTQVTAQGVEELKKALPTCRVVW
jgi:hypothetical protein